MNYRQSFLRKHIAQQLAKRHGLEVLAVEELLSQIDAMIAKRPGHDRHDADGQRIDRDHPLVSKFVNYRIGDVESSIFDFLGR